jgi:hypothetical protein
MDAKTFVNEIVVDILGKSVSSDKNIEYGGSYNTLRSCIDRNNGIGYKVSLIVANMIDKELFDFKKDKAIIYLKKFLTDDESKDFNNINYELEQIKKLVFYVSKKLNRSFKKSKLVNTKTELTYKIVDISTLLKMGWTLEKYMIQCSNMWDDTMENKMTDEHKGGIEQWIKIVKEYPDNSRILLNDKNEMVGFWDFVTLFDDEYKRLKSGKLNDCELTVDIMPPMIPGTYNIYFASICLKDNYKKTLALQKLLISMLNVFEELALNGVFIDEICTWAYTNSGIALSKALGFEYHIEHKEHGKIFCTTMVDLLKQPLAKKFKTLKAFYNQHFQDYENKN